MRIFKKIFPIKLILKVYILGHGMKRTIFIFLIFFGCSAYNVYSPTNPTNIDDVQDSEVLIAMGDEYFENGDYENAFKAYLRAESLSPTKSRAIEGKVNAYIAMKIHITNFIVAFQENDYSKVGDLNLLYDVSRFASINLYKIINNETNNKIPYDDINVNLNYYLFGNFFSIFYFIDYNTNYNIVNDTNDLIVLKSYNEIDTNNSKFFKTLSILDENPPNPFKMLEIVNIASTLIAGQQTLKSNLGKVDQSINNILNNLVSTEARDFVISITNLVYSNFTKSILDMDELLKSLNLSNTNISISMFTNIFEITNLISLTNIEITNDDMITDYIFDAGYNTNDYDSLTNDLYNAGITNLNDITNIIPSMTNISSVVSNYFDL